MVKKSVQGQSGATLKDRTAPTAVVFGKTKQSSRFSFWHMLPQRQKLVILVCIVAIIAGIGVYKYQNRTITVQLLTQKQGTEQHLADLNSTKPAAGASKQAKTKYYADLEITKADVKDYAGAIAAFKQREAINKPSLTYHDYFKLAEYYKTTGDTAKAGAALDTATTVLPPNNNGDTGYVRSDVVNLIEAYRQELKK